MRGEDAKLSISFRVCQAKFVSRSVEWRGHRLRLYRGSVIDTVKRSTRIDLKRREFVVYKLDLELLSVTDKWIPLHSPHIR